MPQNRLALIAGAGPIPVEIAKAALAAGRSVVAIAMSEAAAATLSSFCCEVHLCAPARAGRAIALLKRSGASEVVLSGKLDKSSIFKEAGFDLRALKLMARAKLKSDGMLLGAVADEIRAEGFELIDQMAYLRHLAPKSGIMTKRRPGARELRDARFGIELAKKIASLGIGQTVVVKDGVVAAVEAADGSDEAIKRGCSLAGQGAVVAKVSWPHLRSEFEVPAVGPGTISAMATGKASALAIEAEAVIIISKDESLDLANKNAISIVAL